MKTTCYTSLANRSSGLRKRFAILFLVTLVLNSCKKELLTAETEDNIIKSQTGAASIKPISYTDFLKKVNLNKIGKVGELFRDNPSSTSLRIENSSTSGLALEIETTNIKELKAKGHVSYVFPIKLSSKYAQRFSNLTIDLKGDTVRAFVNT